MPAKPDSWIIQMCERFKMIEPFAPEQIRTGISFGVSSYGYDISLSNRFKLPVFPGKTEVDPKRVQETDFTDTTCDSLLLPSGSFVLAQSHEYFRIPRSIITICFGKSTYARCGLIVNVTPFEPEWEGFATISLSNTGSLPVRVYAREGIAQLLFLESDQSCLQSYADKKGKYQAQTGITLAKGSR